MVGWGLARLDRLGGRAAKTAEAGRRERGGKESRAGGRPATA
jgi:hypothetical protein